MYLFIIWSLKNIKVNMVDQTKNKVKVSIVHNVLRLFLPPNKRGLLMQSI